MCHNDILSSGAILAATYFNEIHFLGSTTREESLISQEGATQGQRAKQESRSRKHKGKVTKAAWNKKGGE